MDYTEKRENVNKFKHSRFDIHPYNGETIHVCLIDSEDDYYIEHGDKSEEV